jgi:hypothetical protein
MMTYEEKAVEFADFAQSAFEAGHHAYGAVLAELAQVYATLALTEATRSNVK